MHTPIARRFGATLIAAGLAAALAPTTPATAQEPDPGQPVEITDGELVWGIKESWRNYVGHGQLSEGVTVNDDGLYVFPVASGTFDPATNTTSLRFDGRIHWQAYPDYPIPGRYGLDVTFTDLSLTIGPGEQVIRFTSISNSQDDPGGDPEESSGVLARLDVTTATAAFQDGQATWDGITAVAGPDMGLYPAGTPIDPVSFAYTGPGGVPELGATWDEPGHIMLEPGGRWVSDHPPGTRSGSGRQLYVSGQGDVVHVAEMSGGDTEDALLTITARDAETLEPKGQPVEVTYPVANQGQYLITGFDPDTDSVFYVTGREGDSEREVRVRVARWNRSTGSYDRQVVGRLADHGTNSDGRIRDRDIGAVVWNPLRSELAVTTELDPPADDPYMTDELNRFRRAGDGWAAQVSPIRLPQEGRFAQATRVRSPFTYRAGIPFDDWRTLAVARDGSYVQAPGAAYAEVDGERHYWPAIHLTVGGDGVVATSLINGTTPAPDANGTYFGFGSVATAADGSLLLHNSQWLPESFLRVDIVDGEAVAVGEPHLDYDTDPDAAYAYSTFAGSMAADQDRGWEWVTNPTDPDGHVLQAVRDGEVFSRFDHRELVGHAQGYALLGVHPDGSLYVPIQDQDSGHFGYQRYAYRGVTPTITSQPVDTAVAVPPDESSVAAGFVVEVDDEYGGEVQWQAKPASASEFSDIEGATGTELMVDATVEDDGGQYRAVVTNDAGSIVSDVATLTVARDGGDPGEAEQSITVLVPERTGAGEFIWSIEGNRAVDLGEAVDQGAFLRATGAIVPISVADTRSGGPEWSISGQVSDFAGGVSGSYLGWTPAVIETGAGAVAGDPVSSGFDGGDGLSVASTLAAAGAGHEQGTARLGADLELRLPADVLRGPTPPR